MYKFAFITIAFASISNAYSDGQSSQFDLMKGVLLENFPEHKAIIGPWDDGQVAVREYPGDFVKGILVGDFNSDGSTDFAAKLARPLTAGEIEELNPPARDRMFTAEIVVVCDAEMNAQNDKHYRCYEIVEQKIGGVHATLDYMDWESYLDTLKEGEQPVCQSAIRSRSGSKSLSLLEPIGHCDTFYYPKRNGGYNSCVFCAD